MSADYVCYYRDLSLGLHFLLTNSFISLFLWPSLYQWERRLDGTILDPLCHPYLLYFLCFRYSQSFLIFRCSDQVFWSLQFTASSPWPLIYFFPILHILILQFHFNVFSLKMTYTGCLPTLLFLLLSCCFVSSLDCAMQCGRVKDRTLLLSWKILALTRSLDYIW